MMTLFNLPAQGLSYLLLYKLSSPELLLPPMRGYVRWKIQHSRLFIRFYSYNAK